MTKLLLTLAVVMTAFGASPVEPVNKTRGGAGLKGYDPVAYFEQGRGRQGIAAVHIRVDGSDVALSSSENRDLFAKDPQKYAPQFGGYCAWAVGHGYTANIDPEAWRIVDGKLYLNCSKSVQKMWEQDYRRWIEAGNDNWPKLHK